MSKISSVRGKMASALECSDCVERASTSRHRSPRRAHSFARNRPTGPAPTIRTSVSIAVLLIISSLCLPVAPKKQRVSARFEFWNTLLIVSQLLFVWRQMQPDYKDNPPGKPRGIRGENPSLARMILRAPPDYGFARL